LAPEGLNSLSYSLDEKIDVQIAIVLPDVWGPETPLPFSDVLYGLADGEHTLRIHGLTSQGAVFGENRTFTVDNISGKNEPAPSVSILFPRNETYGSPDAHLTALNFWTNKPFAWARYSLDGKANGTITGNWTLYESTIGEGYHSITVYTMDALGQETSASSYFSLLFSTYPGQLKLLSPQNLTCVGNVTLAVAKNGAVTWVAYSLDNQTENLLFGNITLTNLSLGTHSLILRFGDILGNIGNESVQFTVAERLPQTFPMAPIVATSAVSVALAVALAAVYFKKRKRNNEPR
jgi:hypothetical protein